MAEYSLSAAVLKVRAKPVNFAFYKGQDDHVILLDPRPITPKQVAPLEKEHGELKRVTKGLCFWENDVLTFATRTPPSPAWEAQMTKVFRAEGCSKHLPLVLRALRADEAEEVESSDEEQEGGEQGSKQPPATPEAKANAGTPPATEEQESAETKSAEPAEATSKPVAPKPDPAVLKAALEKLLPAVKAAIAANPALKEDFTRLITELQGQLKAGETTEARGTLMEVGALVKSLEGKPPVTTAGPKTAGQPDGSLVAYKKLRLAWEAAQKKAREELKLVENAIVAEYQGTTLETKITTKVRVFDKVLATFDENLGDFLDKADTATDPAERTKFHGEAARLSKKFFAYVQADPFLKDIDTNPFQAVTVHKSLSSTLTALNTRLA